MQQNVNLNLILDQVAKDKGIDRQKLVEILEESLANAGKRHFDTVLSERGLAPIDPARLYRGPESHLRLADYVLPPMDGRRDHIAIFVVTAGVGVRKSAEAAKAAGEYFRSHALQSLALESADQRTAEAGRAFRLPDEPVIMPTPRTTGLRILVAEDHPVNRAVAKHVGTMAGGGASVAASALNGGG